MQRYNKDPGTAKKSAEQKRGPSTFHLPPGYSKEIPFFFPRVLACKHRREPAVPVDTKNQEVPGNHTNAGQTYCPKGEPREVDTHDFPDPELGY